MFEWLLTFGLGAWVYTRTYACNALAYMLPNTIGFYLGLMAHTFCVDYVIALWGVPVIYIGMLQMCGYINLLTVLKIHLGWWALPWIAAYFAIGAIFSCARLWYELHVYGLRYTSTSSAAAASTPESVDATSSRTSRTRRTRNSDDTDTVADAGSVPSAAPTATTTTATQVMTQSVLQAYHRHLRFWAVFWPVSLLNLCIYEPVQMAFAFVYRVSRARYTRIIAHYIESNKTE